MVWSNRNGRTEMVYQKWSKKNSKDKQNWFSYIGCISGISSICNVILPVHLLFYHIVEIEAIILTP